MRKKLSNILSLPCGVVSPPSVLKGVLWGSLLLRKRAWFCFGVHQRFAKLDKINRGENVQGRNRIGEKIRNSIYEKKTFQHSFIAL